MYSDHTSAHAHTSAVSALREEELSIAARDGYALSARLFLPDGPPVGSVVISAATAVPQSFYASYARWLAEHGFAALTWDYRGIGASLRGSMRHAEGDILAWGRLDAPAILDALHARFPNLPLTWIGHSVGGHLPGFIDNPERITRILTVACGSGYVGMLHPRIRLRTQLLWRVITPLSVAIAGYFPGKRLGILDDLPRGAIMQWRHWSLHPNYLLRDDEAARRAGFERYTIPVHMLSFEDDELMTAASIAFVADLYRRAQITHHRLTRHELTQRVGHVGWFRKDKRDMWEEHLTPWLTSSHE